MGFGEQFLTEPALFPARLAGATAGDLSLAVDVPGGPYLIQGLSRSQLEALSERYGERCLGSSALEASIALEVFAALPNEFIGIDRTGWTNTLDFDYGEHAVRIAGDRVMAQIAWRPELTAALWTPPEAGDGFLERFENCFRILVAYRLLELGGVVLHSSGVVSAGKAWVFFGHSGAGKTTIARRSLSTGRTVLSDDINALFIDDCVTYAAKMPFAGELGHTNERIGPFPLAALNRIEHAATEWWRPLSTAQAVAALLSCAPFLNTDPYRLPRLMANLEALARGARTGALGFSLGGDIWATLEAPST
ncbi:MAG: hypothetical protein O7A98_10475 [Acidobacteria bacterium]|nr:hypothetical protein [Acidobacteriota bacterium]